MTHDDLASRVGAIIDTVPRNPEVIAADVEGMTSPKVRHLLNRLVAYLSPGTHLEVGTYKGATLISSLYGNIEARGLAYENFGEHAVRKELFANLARYQGRIGSYRLLEEDFFPAQLPLDLLPIRSFFYDGDHAHASQRDAVLKVQPHAADPFVLVVDDWNWPAVRGGTWQGIAEARFQRVTFWELYAEHNRDVNNYHNGLGVLVLSSSSARLPERATERTDERIGT